MPKISIGMPVYNCASTISPSVKSVLGQTYKDWELLIIDDGSNDSTLDILHTFKDPRIKIISDGKHLGLIQRLNYLIDRSEGEYFARMDGDDISYSDRLEKQVNFLQQNREVDLVGTSAIVFKQNGLVIGKRPVPAIHEKICARPASGFPIIHPSFCGRTEWFKRYKYNSKAMRSEDKDLLLRSFRYSRFANIPEILMGYREESIELNKNLKGRFFYIGCIVKEFYRQREIGNLIRGVMEELILAIVDIFAIKSGLGYKILRHRALPVAENEKKGWEKTWSSINQ